LGVPGLIVPELHPQRRRTNAATIGAMVELRLTVISELQSTRRMLRHIREESLKANMAIIRPNINNNQASRPSQDMDERRINVNLRAGSDRESASVRQTRPC
jgi:hypothetical protein